MTKPAAAAVQLIGVVLMFLSFPFLSWVMFGIGVALVFAGGAAARKRIREDRSAKV